jgi:hypothetical protein
VLSPVWVSTRAWFAFGNDSIVKSPPIDPALLVTYLALERRLPRPSVEYEQRLAELDSALAAVLAAAPGAQPPEPAAGRDAAAS